MMGRGLYVPMRLVSFTWSYRHPHPMQMLESMSACVKAAAGLGYSV